MQTVQLAAWVPKMAVGAAMNVFFFLPILGFFRATDHGGNREGEQLLRFGADRGVVPQIMEEIVVRRCRRCSSCGYGRPCDHAATWGSEQLLVMAAVKGFSAHFAPFFALLRLSRR